MLLRSHAAVRPTDGRSIEVVSAAFYLQYGNPPRCHAHGFRQAEEASRRYVRCRCRATYHLTIAAGREGGGVVAAVYDCHHGATLMQPRHDVDAAAGYEVLRGSAADRLAALPPA